MTKPLVKKFKRVMRLITARRYHLRESTIWALDPEIHFQAFKQMSEIVQPCDNWIYFSSVIFYGGRLRTIQKIYDQVFKKHAKTSICVQEWFPFLNPPNLASLDFLLNNFENPGSLTVLDYACGIGAFGLYANRLGYPIWLFDNTSQLSPESLKKFWQSFGMTERLVQDWNVLQAGSINIMNCVGCRIPRKTIIAMAESGKVDYFLVDSKFIPQGMNIPGYKVVGYYPGLIWIYKKKQGDANS